MYVGSRSKKESPTKAFCNCWAREGFDKQNTKHERHTLSKPPKKRQPRRPNKQAKLTLTSSHWAWLRRIAHSLLKLCSSSHHGLSAATHEISGSGAFLLAGKGRPRLRPRPEKIEKDRRKVSEIIHTCTSKHTYLKDNMYYVPSRKKCEKYLQSKTKACRLIKLSIRFSRYTLLKKRK